MDLKWYREAMEAVVFQKNEKATDMDMMEMRTVASTTLTKFYHPKKKRVIFVPIRILTELKPKIVQISIQENSTTLKMAPEWFEYHDYDEALKNIVYPKGITKQQKRTLDTVARYRAATDNSENNFHETPLKAGENETETLISALHYFVQQFGGDLAFTNENVTFEQAAYRTACGIANLSSAHLLATNYIRTAKFSFFIDLDYQNDLAQSNETMQNFVLNFSDAIAEVLTCPNDYVRVISLEKPKKKQKQTEINFGLTTPNPVETEQLADDLKVQAQKGFPKHRVLKHVQPDDYECQWMPLISYFEIEPAVFDSTFNFKYTSDLPTEDRRGSLPYYLPIGWCRHGLNIFNKFPDGNVWLDSDNVAGEWAIAFHGTKVEVVKSMTQDGLSTREIVKDRMREEAVEQRGTEFDKPGLYVTTHCNGGAYPTYTKPFSVPSSQNKSETFRVVFQCRVKPDAYTTHTLPVSKGEAWRFVDPDAIRPYGILVKKEEAQN